MATRPKSDEPMTSKERKLFLLNKKKAKQKTIQAKKAWEENEDETESNREQSS